MTPELSPLIVGSNSREGICEGLSVGASERRSLFIPSAITEHLNYLGYPLKSLDSLLKCGFPSGNFINARCNCGVRAIPLVHRCNKRICPECSKSRKRRIFKNYLPFFKSFVVNKSYFFQFLTISPKNYDSIEFGLKDIKINFKKFLRRKYIKNRIKAGFYVLEVKESKNKGFNIHIHAVLYGRWLDYRLRGHCLDCSQNLLKFNKSNKKFYCANRKCNSLNVIVKKDTKLNNEWFDSVGSHAHIYGERVNSSRGAVHYLTKYVSISKDDFYTNKSLAEYIFYSHKLRFINKFGSFYKLKIIFSKIPCLCPKCNSNIEFFIDMEISLILLNFNKPPDINVLFGLTTYLN